MSRRVVFVFLFFVVAALCSCASGSGGQQAEDGPRAQAAAAKGVAPPASSPLSKVKLGMNDAEVRKILGDPDNSNSYMTGKSWIPFYYGTDTSRSDWMYKGMGRVVFSRNQYSGGLKVIRIDYNPNETAGM
jgi:outer membrane protein assembly factor BamE (lipoprotein component of BamABCDE complex)